VDLPEDLAEHAGEHGAVGGVDVEPADEAAQFFFGQPFGTVTDEAADGDGFEEGLGQAIEFGRGSTLLDLPFRARSSRLRAIS
jgi:hypothetical protein